MAKKSPDNPWASPNGKRPPQMPRFSPEMGNYPQETAENGAQTAQTGPVGGREEAARPLADQLLGPPTPASC
jgi:hypothetical protein